MQWNKVWIIFQKEYLERTRKRSFWLGTLLVPVLLVVVSTVPVIIAMLSDSEERITVLVQDPGGQLLPRLLAKSDEGMVFEPTNQTKDQLLPDLLAHDSKLLLILPASTDKHTLAASCYSSSSISLATETRLTAKVKEAIRELRLNNAGMTLELLKETTVDLTLNTSKVSAQGEEKTSALLASGIGYIMSFIIYGMIMGYGALLMKGVIEEKSNRVVEILATSIRPTDLMTGKIGGIAAVGLTQYAVWLVLYVLLTIVSMVALAAFAPGGAPDASASPALSPEQAAQARELIGALTSFRISYIFYFLYFFLFGFLFYGSLFAALGAMVEHETDAQGFMWFIFMPLILAVMVSGSVIAAPDSPLAVIVSLIPLFSPIIMMERLAATEVPLWQQAISMALLPAAAMGAAWMAGRIFRAGLLLYGKKPTLKEVARWVVRGA